MGYKTISRRVRIPTFSRSGSDVINDLEKTISEAHAARKHVITKYMRRAKKEDYEKWLLGHILRRNHAKLTYTDEKFNCCRSWFVATKDFRLPGHVKLRGKYALRIIVPPHVDWIGGERGHCELYYMDSFSATYYMVWIYSDINIGDLGEF